MKNKSPTDLREEYRSLYYLYGMCRLTPQTDLKNLEARIYKYEALWKLWETVVRRNQYHSDIGFSSTENY